LFSKDITFIAIDPYSQEYAKALFPDICPIPIQANKARKFIGVSFDLNDTVIKLVGSSMRVEMLAYWELIDYSYK